MLHTLISFIRARTPADGLRWLEAALAGCTPGRPVDTLLRAYTAAPRKVGRQPLSLDGDETRQVLAHDPALSFIRWTVADAVRAALLLKTAEVEGGDESFEALALACYEHGDAREQQSWLRALPIVPGAERFLATAIDACRTNILPLFESIACENPFPARRFPDRNFNQMVLKALFNGIALERVVALPSRLNPELARMADDYVTERERAGRTVPPDIGLVIAPYAEGRSLERLRRYSTTERDTR
jgi:hypothetical protein